MGKRMIDLFCGRGGWTKGFLANGWEVRGYDLNPQPDYPKAAEFIQADVLDLTADDLRDADFICCSSPCEEFSVHCMKHFHPNPKHPEMGIRLFEHTRNIFEQSGIKYVMENVRCAEKFVGKAVNHCGPFYLWGNSVPAIMPRAAYSVQKGMAYMSGATFRRFTPAEICQMRTAADRELGGRKARTSRFAEIPSVISHYIAEQFS